MEYRKQWQLDSLFHGTGSSYDQIDAGLDTLATKIKNFKWHLPDAFTPYQTLISELQESGTLILCLTSQDVTDERARELEAKHASLSGDFEALNLELDRLLLAMSESEFQSMLKKVEEISFPIKERKKLAEQKMSLEKELLVNELSISGHEAFTTLYYSVIGQLEFPVAGEKLNLSRLENLFDSTDHDLRAAAVKSMDEVLTKHKSIFGQILNNIVDYRLRLFKARGWNDVLHESLFDNKMTEKTLNTMWQAVSKNKKPLTRYMDQKAKLLGLKKLKWSDLGAPLGNADETKIPWEKGCSDIVSQFAKFSPKMAEYAKHALQKGWVDAAPSHTKRAGGFCTGAPLLKESRILMTYMDTFGSLSTLAHELGHGFHSHVLKDRPPLVQDYPMNIAEAASTMCEMIVNDSALKNASSPKEKLILLDDKIGRYVAFNMDLHSRFLFDKAFHEERKDHFVSTDRANELMVEAQKIGFADHLEDYLPCFWSYKMHFYFTDVTFYNWTYTFGYLFSLGTYAHLLKIGDFEKRYIALLRDSGSMMIEELAKKHLDVDLTRIDFWQNAMDILNRDIEEFLILSEKNLL